MNGFKRRVVISGLGAVSPIGLDVASLTDSLKHAKCGAEAIRSFDIGSFPVKRACEVKAFNAREDGTHIMDPFIQYAIRAAKEALADARFDPSEVDPFTVGISVSSSKGGVHTLDRFRERFEKNPSAILGARVYANMVPNFAAQWIARRWKIKGAARCYVAACATGTTAVIEGAKMVASGDVEFCMAGASDASIVPVMLAGYHKMKVLAKDSIRPFSKNRDGFLAGEGAGIVFIETLESAQKRGATIYGEISGYAYAQDAFHPIHFDPNGETIARVLRGLMKENKMKRPTEIDYINLHGTGTYEGDLYETRQLKKAFGEEAKKIAMSSTKSMTGHMLGASGAVEIIASLIAMKEGFIPPTAGLTQRDPECDLDYVPNEARKADIKHAFSYSAGFGGHAAGISLRKVS